MNEKELLNILIGLQIFLKVGITINISAGNGVIYCGDCVDTNQEEEMLDNLGWKYDEDNSQFYYLLDKASISA